MRKYSVRTKSISHHVSEIFKFLKHATEVPYDVIYSTNSERKNIYGNNGYILLKLCSYANTDGTFQCAQLLLDIFLIWGSLLVCVQ